MSSASALGRPPGSEYFAFCGGWSFYGSDLRFCVLVGWGGLIREEFVRSDFPSGVSGVGVGTGGVERGCWWGCRGWWGVVVRVVVVGFDGVSCGRGRSVCGRGVCAC